MGKKLLLIICCISAGLVGMAVAVLPVGYFLGLIPPSRAMVVLSGSMAPELKVGSLVIVAKADNYLTNEIISFSPSGDPKDIVTHRIVSKEYPEGAASPPVFLTAGDVNKSFDYKKIKPEQIIGKVVFSVPYLGYLANFVKQPYGFILFMIVPATIIVYEELKSIKRSLLEFHRKRKKEKEESKIVEEEAGVNKLAIIVPLFAAVLALTSLSLSYFSDRELSSGNSFAAGVWVTPPPIADYLVINEVYYDPDSTHQISGQGGENRGEWVEIYNPRSDTVNINGWIIEDNTAHEDLPNIDIPSHGYVIVSGATQSELRAKWVIPTSGVQFIETSGGKVGNGFNNAGDLLRLKSNSTTIVDQISWGGDTSILSPAPPDVLTGHSLERNPDGLDTNTAGDFVDRASPTPGS